MTSKRKSMTPTRKTSAKAKIVGVPATKPEPAAHADTGQAPLRKRAAKASPTSAPTAMMRPGTKLAVLVATLRQPGGASLGDIAAETGWQHHSIRGAISGHLKKKLGLAVVSARGEDGTRRYSLGA